MVSIGSFQHSANASKDHFKFFFFMSTKDSQDSLKCRPLCVSLSLSLCHTLTCRLVPRLIPVQMAIICLEPVTYVFVLLLRHWRLAAPLKPHALCCNSLCQHKGTPLAFCWHYPSSPFYKPCPCSRFAPFGLSHSIQLLP